MRTLMARLKINLSIARWATGVFFLSGGCLSLGADEKGSLTLTQGQNQTQVQVLHDMKGKSYLPLTEVAQFYGVQLQFDSQTRKVTLTKGKIQANLALSQPLFMASDPEMSIPIEPVEMVSGQLGITPASVEDVFGTMLDAQVNYSPDKQTITAGEVREDESAPIPQAQPPINSSAVPATPTAVGVTQVAVPTAVPTLEPNPEEDVEAPKTQGTSRSQNLEEEPPSNKTIRAQRIVIDAGHGGTDAGAPSRDRRYFEKEATLDIARKVAEYLKEKDPQLEVLLTRRDDYYITLKYRTDFANAHSADLFVSIHCNSNPREEAHGTEIYYYGAKASNKWAAMAAERENEGKDNRIPFMSEFQKEGYVKYSEELARRVEKSIEYHLGQHFRNIQHAPFYVLAHTNMPSILVETAFISNQKEENKLKDPYWKDNMAKAITEGILDYKDMVEGNEENEQARR
jgi:N-acetylmuramoyl-L-alanine amidase